MYIIIGSVVGLLFILVTIISIYHNKFQFCIIKIDEAENNIGVLLDKKRELLERTRPIIKKELKLEEFLEKINDWDSNNFNHFEINSILKDCSYDLFKLLDENEKLYKLVVSFPSKLIAFLFRYKKKQFHNNEKREMYEILNEK